MRNTYSLITLGFALVFLASCNKKPTADFSIDNPEPLISEEVSFTNSSSEGITYLWDFGDGTSSGEQSPVHAYDAEGTYEVTLTVYSKDQKKWSSTTQSLVVQHPEFLFTGKLNGVETKLYEDIDGNFMDYDMQTAVTGTGINEIVYKTAIGKYTTGQVNIGIDLGTVYLSDTLTKVERYPFMHYAVSEAEYPFSVAALAGVRVYYKASNGVIWASDAGTANQTGSSFIITWTAHGKIGNDEIERFKAHVNCKLYNGLGQSMTIKDGIFELAFASL